MTTPVLSIEERVTVLETRFDTILPTLATKADVAVVATEITRLEGKMDAMNERLEGKMDVLNGRMDILNERMDAMGNRLLVKFVGIMIPALAVVVAAVKYL